MVLEQHYIAGGCTHCFEDHGVEHETGFHYIGNIEKRIPILNLITENEIDWCKMGHEDPETFVYDEIVIGDKHYKFRAGADNFTEDLIQLFPEEENAIRKYIQVITVVSQKDFFLKLKVIYNNWLRKFLSFFIGKDYQYYASTSAYDVIKTLTNNEELIAVLCGQFGDYGPTPKNASFFIHASIVNHYLEGGYYPKGGPQEIIKQIIPVIEKAGGRVLVGKKVKNIIINYDTNTAKGVVMENGDKIYASKIVSSTGIRNTFLSLLQENSLRSHYSNILSNIPPSVSHIYLFVNLKGTPEELKLRSS